MAVAIVFGVVAGDRGARANIETEDGAVTSPELPTLRPALRYTETGDLRDLRFEPSFTLGLTRRLELRLTVPVVLHRRVELNGLAGRQTEKELSGLADVRLRAKWSLFQVDDVMESTRWALLAEIVAPTATHDRRDGGVEIPRPLQLGLGAWGTGAGTVVTVVRDRHRFSADAVFRHRTRHDGFRLGPSIDVDVAYWFRLTPARFEPGEHALEVRLVAELLGSWRFRGRIGAERLDDDGPVVFAAPGVQLYVTPTVQLEASVRLPLIDLIEDDLGHRRWGALLTAKIRF